MSQLPADRRETWITGIGLVSSLGDGLEENWDALRSGRVNIDQEKYAPWMIHPLAPLNLDSQIPKKGDQRQMEISRSKIRPAPFLPTITPSRATTSPRAIVITGHPVTSKPSHGV